MSADYCSAPTLATDGTWHVWLVVQIDGVAGTSPMSQSYRVCLQCGVRERLQGGSTYAD